VGGGTPITRNGANPNFVFRVSAVDEIVDRAMLQYSQKTFNAKSCGMILVNNPWASRTRRPTAALAAKGMKPAASKNSKANDVDVVPQLTRLKSQEPTACSWSATSGLPRNGEVARSHGLESPDRLALGPCRRRFTELAGPSAKDVHFIQTYSFFGKQCRWARRY